RADAAELVHARETAEDHVVADHDMAGQRGVVGEYAVVPDHAVVGDMRVGQQPVVAADAGDPAAFAGAAIERHELADQVAVANLERDALAAVLLVLWIAADRGVSDDAVLATDARRTLHAAVWADERSVADLDIGSDQGERADRHSFADARGRIHDRGGMDAGLPHVSCAPRRTGCRRRPPVR